MFFSTSTWTHFLSWIKLILQNWWSRSKKEEGKRETKERRKTWSWISRFEFRFFLFLLLPRSSENHKRGEVKGNRSFFLSFSRFFVFVSNFNLMLTRLWFVWIWLVMFLAWISPALHLYKYIYTTYIFIRPNISVIQRNKEGRRLFLGVRETEGGGGDVVPYIAKGVFFFCFCLFHHREPFYRRWTSS